MTESSQITNLVAGQRRDDSLGEAGCTQRCARHVYGFSEAKGEEQIPGSLAVLEDQKDVATRLYTPIKPWQTQLLDLQPGAFGSPLKGVLRVAHVMEGDGLVLKDEDFRVSYTALSYCWGEPLYCRPLEVNGELYPITESLFHTLQRVRPASKPLFVWTDMVCIHQHNNVERSLQLRNMLRIYEKAEHVVGWLGEHSGHSRLVIELLRSKQFSQQWLQSDVEQESDHARPQFCAGHMTSLSDGLREVVDLPWFRRVWVKQEVWAARKLTVQFGESNLPWQDFQRLSRLADITDNSRTLSLKQDITARLGGLWVASSTERLGVQMDDRPALNDDRPALNDDTVDSDDYTVDYHPWRDKPADTLNLIGRAAGCECSDPRDRVYGLLGMTPIKVVEAMTCDSARLSLAVDYTKHPVTIFQDLMRYLIRREGTLNPLALGATFGSEVQGRKLPSWVIDWSRPVSKTP
ncbi:hypothetical protein LTR85_007503 [Meristemomyces frigidus]|nr:hypothetical protein LTR85_007503 [Meristemomyces frigidus]